MGKQPVGPLPPAPPPEPKPPPDPGDGQFIVDAEGKAGPYPVNPNGSMDDIAGICDPSGRVMGLMPHPERFVDITHHPQWTRHKIDRADGLIVFRRAAQYLTQ